MFILQECLEVPGVTFLRLSGKPTDDELETYLTAERAKARKSPDQKLAMVMELREVWTSRQRRMMRDFELEMTKLSPHQSLGMAIVVPNALIRGAFTAYFWLAPPEYPTKMVPSATAAFDFIQERLLAGGLPVPTRQAFEKAANADWPARQAVPGQGMVPVEAERLPTLLAS